MARNGHGSTLHARRLLRRVKEAQGVVVVVTQHRRLYSTSDGPVGASTGPSLAKHDTKEGRSFRMVMALGRRWWYVQGTIPSLIVGRLSLLESHLHSARLPSTQKWDRGLVDCFRTEYTYLSRVPSSEPFLTTVNSTTTTTTTTTTLLPLYRISRLRSSLHPRCPYIPSSVDTTDHPPRPGAFRPLRPSQQPSHDRQDINGLAPPNRHH